MKSVSHLYKESRALSLANIRLFSDDRVCHALGSKETREGTWGRKFSSAIMTKNVIVDITSLLSSPPPAVMNLDLDIFRDSLSSEEEAAAENLITAPLNKYRLKRVVQGRIQSQVDDYWKDKISGYVMQGDCRS
jgi:hypothetical protein